MKKHSIELTKEQRIELEEVIKNGQARARKLQHAHVLLKMDAGEDGPKWSDHQLREAFGVGLATIWRIRHRFSEHGLSEALNRRPQPERPEKRRVYGEQEAHLIALACSPAPQGHQRWTMRLLADKAVEWGYCEQLDYTTVWHVLKKNELKPWLKKCWCIPAKKSAEYVYRMEDVLEVYHRPYDARFPQVCMDEGSKQLLADIQAPLAMEPGTVKKEDYEYERRGTCSIFVAVEPLAGKRFLQVTPQRTKKDWAYFMREVIDTQYPEAEKVILVMDNLNTHVFSSFYETFEPAEARRLIEKLELHYTPKHGSWLNMAEIELSILARQCLARRVPSIEQMREHILSWQEERNHSKSSINWRFTTADARIKLKRLYPSFN